MYQIDFGANYSANLRPDLGFQLDQSWQGSWLIGLHTAEVTGSIPVMRTSQNASQAHSNGPLARRSARRSRAWGVFKNGQPGWVRAAVESTDNCALVGPRWL